MSLVCDRCGCSNANASTCSDCELAMSHAERKRIESGSPACVVCGDVGTSLVEVMARELGNNVLSLNVQHHLCSAHLSQWSFRIGIVTGEMMSKKRGGL